MNIEILTTVWSYMDEEEELVLKFEDDNSIVLCKSADRAANIKHGMYATKIQPLGETICFPDEGLYIDATRIYMAKRRRRGVNL